MKFGHFDRSALEPHYYAMAVSRELSGDMRGCESTCVCHAILHSA